MRSAYGVTPHLPCVAVNRRLFFSNWTDLLQRSTCSLSAPPLLLDLDLVLLLESRAMDLRNIPRPW